MATKAQEMAEKIAAKREELKKIFDEHSDGNGGFKAMSQEIREDIQKRNRELDDLGKEYKAQADLEKIDADNKKALEELNAPDRSALEFPDPGRQSQEQPQVKSLGQIFVESQEYKAAAERGLLGSQQGLVVKIPDVSIKHWMANATKTLVSETGTGFAPANNRTNIVIPSAQRKPVVADFVPATDTNVQVVKYMEETTFTNNAAARAEGAALTESALAWTERSSTVQSVGTVIPVTEEQLQDVASLQDLIDQRMSLMLLLTEETQLLSGSGTSPQLTGFYNKAGIQTQAKGTDDTPSAIFKAFTKIRHTGFAEPNVVFMHPNDWQDIRLLKDANGNFIWGNPATAGPESIWGVQVVPTTAATENTCITGDFRMFSHISRNKGATIEAGFINDDFKNLRKSLRIYERLSLEIYRAAAFCTVSGI